MIDKFLRKKNFQIRLLQYFFFFYTLISLFIVDFEWILFGFVFYIFLETFAGNIGLHRYFGHKSFTVSNKWHNILTFLSHYIGVGSVLSWVGQHRHHHLYSDTNDDIHSPKHQGYLNIIFGIWNVSIDKKLVKDVIKDKKLVKWHKKYFVFHFIVILFYLIIDYIFNSHFLFSAYTLPNLMCLISGYVLATVTHSHGYKTYDLGNDLSTNSWIANLYTLGEGWHNNHHFNPKKLRQGEKWWEWDLPAFIVEKLVLKNA